MFFLASNIRIELLTEAQKLRLLDKQVWLLLLDHNVWNGTIVLPYISDDYFKDLMTRRCAVMCPLDSMDETVSGFSLLHESTITLVVHGLYLTCT